MQANTIAEALNNAFDIPTYFSGIVIAVLAGIIVAGGFRSIAKFAERIVPFMGIAFVLCALGVTLMNLSAVPNMLLDIIMNAFGIHEAGAGALGAAIKNGIQRGLYSNEAGAGSVPHAAAAAAPNPNHPAAQGYVQTLGVFIDTIVLCTCTAFIILLSNTPISGEMEGISLTQSAMAVHLGGWGDMFVAAAITLFAFTSVVANYAYAESNLHLFKMDNRIGRTMYTCVYLLMVFWGATASLKLVWSMADVALGLMTLVNVYAVYKLTPTIVNITKDYHEKLTQPLTLSFKPSDIHFQGKTEKGIWSEK